MVLYCIHTWGLFISFIDNTEVLLLTYHIKGHTNQMARRSESYGGGKVHVSQTVYETARRANICLKEGENENDVEMTETTKGYTNTCPYYAQTR